MRYKIFGSLAQDRRNVFNISSDSCSMVHPVQLTACLSARLMLK